MKTETYLDVNVHPGKWYISRIIPSSCCSSSHMDRESLKKTILIGPFDSDIEAEAAQTSLDDPADTEIWEG